MKIAVDLDGTAWKYKNFFIFLIKILKQNNCNIGILTAHTMKLKNSDLKLWKARGFPEPDFYICKTIPNIPVGPWKAQMMNEYNIDILFDDFENNNQDVEKDFFDVLKKTKIILKVY